MRVLFMGSDELACPALERIHGSDRHAVPLVVTQPDRPFGRKLQLRSCPARVCAERLGLEVFTPEKVGDPESRRRVDEARADIIVVAAYGQYIPSLVLNVTPYEPINIHPSLLPKYRGASPIQWTLANGDAVSGVTILYVAREMDAGDIVLQEEHPVRPDDTYPELKRRLAELGGRLVLEAMDRIEAGTADRIPQDPEKVVTVAKLTKDDGWIDWTLPARAIDCRIRGFTPWPSCRCELPAGSGHRLKVLRASIEPGSGPPGTVLDASGDGPLMAAGEGALRLIEVQPEGKRAMSGRDYLNGHPVRAGDRAG